MEISKRSWHYRLVTFFYRRFLGDLNPAYDEERNGPKVPPARMTLCGYFWRVVVIIITSPFWLVFLACLFIFGCILVGVIVGVMWLLGYYLTEGKTSDPWFHRRHYNPKRQEYVEHAPIYYVFTYGIWPAMGIAHLFFSSYLLAYRGSEMLTRVSAIALMVAAFVLSKVFIIGGSLALLVFIVVLWRSGMLRLIVARIKAAKQRACPIIEFTNG